MVLIKLILVVHFCFEAHFLTQNFSMGKYMLAMILMLEYTYVPDDKACDAYYSQNIHINTFLKTNTN